MVDKITVEFEGVEYELNVEPTMEQDVEIEKYICKQMGGTLEYAKIKAEMYDFESTMSKNPQDMENAKLLIYDEIKSKLVEFKYLAFFKLSGIPAFENRLKFDTLVSAYEVALQGFFRRQSESTPAVN